MLRRSPASKLWRRIDDGTVMASGGQAPSSTAISATSLYRDRPTSHAFPETSDLRRVGWSRVGWLSCRSLGRVERLVLDRAVHPQRPAHGQLGIDTGLLGAPPGSTVARPAWSWPARSPTRRSCAGPRPTQPDRRRSGRVPTRNRSGLAYASCRSLISDPQIRGHLLHGPAGLQQVAVAAERRKSTGWRPLGLTALPPSVVVEFGGRFVEEVPV